jgi:hypothetical protein
MDTRKVILYVVPPVFIGFIAVLIYFIATEGDEQVTESKQEVVDYDLSVEERSERKDKQSKLDLYRRGERGEKGGNVSNDDFYALEGENVEHFEDSIKKDDGEIEYEEKENDYQREDSKQVEPRVVEKIVYVNNNPAPKTEPIEEPKEKEEEPEPIQRTRRRGESLGSLAYGGSSSNSAETGIIYCYVDNDNQKVTNGSDVRLIVTDDCHINGYSVPSGTRIIGKASLQTDRVLIQIKQIFLNGQYININYNVYDVDGTVGIKVSSSTIQGAKDQVAEGTNVNGRGLNVNTPVGTISTGRLSKPNEAPSVVLIDRHKVFIKKS